MTQNTWTQKIKERTDDHETKALELTQAIEVIDMWRARSSILSTILQDLSKPVVKTILNVVFTLFSV